MVIAPTLLALVAGVALGLGLGGSVDRVRRLRPDLWQIGAAALALQLLSQLLGISGGVSVALDLVTRAALIGVALVNLRIGGMVVIASGLALDFIVTLVNWGMPTSRSALVSAGLIDEGEAGTITLRGARHLADGDRLRFLGEVIPLPTGQVVSIGDIVTLVGVVLVIMAVLRGRILPRDASPINAEAVSQRLARVGGRGD
ncbi:MAG: DUF5317 domain-containing protein [Actinobacteria bacterium]|nr:DUF5317 domain-containing protein [Actinomycetota bacterium]